MEKCYTLKGQSVENGLFSIFQAISNILNEETGINLTNVTLDMLGRAKNVKVDKDNTTIVEGAGDAEDLNKRINSIKTQLETESSDYEKEKLSERLAKLSGGVSAVAVALLLTRKQKTSIDKNAENGL